MTARMIKPSTSTIALLSAGLLVAVLGGPAQAGTITSSYGGYTNASADITVSGAGAGMTSWTVNGIDHLQRQWLWYSVDGGAAAQIDAGATTSASFIGDTATLSYDNGSFLTEVVYSIYGHADASVSGIDERVTITNTSGGAITMSLFQYNDFDINGVANTDFAFKGAYVDDVATASTTAITQGDGATLSESNVDPATGLIAYDIVTDGSILDMLTNAMADDALSGDVNDTSVTIIGPGNIEWAWQWNLTIAAGDSFTINKQKSISGFGAPTFFFGFDSPEPATIPEPVSLALFGAGLMAVGMIRRRRKT